MTSSADWAAAWNELERDFLDLGASGNGPILASWTPAVDEFPGFWNVSPGCGADWSNRLHKRIDKGLVLLGRPNSQNRLEDWLGTLLQWADDERRHGRQLISDGGCATVLATRLDGTRVLVQTNPRQLKDVCSVSADYCAWRAGRTLQASSGSYEAAGIDPRSDDFADESRHENARRVDLYINEVFTRTGRQITRKAIWSRWYRSPREFEKWQAGDTKNHTATQRFEKVLREKPHLQAA